MPSSKPEQEKNTPGTGATSLSMRKALAHRSPRSPRNLQRNARDLSRRRRADGAQLERLELRGISADHRHPIGGEYTSVNSGIDELIPARLRGRIDVAVNGSYWFGAAAGAAASLLLLNGTLVSLNLGWRIGFGIGGAFGLVVILLRSFVPENAR
jgi:hypothetical protein